MTVTLTRPTESEWQLTVRLDESADASTWAVASDADAERLAGLLAQFAGMLLVRQGADAAAEGAEAPAICFL